MSKTTSEVQSRRDRVLAQMRSIRSMKRGSVNEQYLKVHHKGKVEPVLRGPYYVWVRYVNGKPVSKRLTSAEQVEEVRKGVEEYRRFVALCKQFVELTERLGELERGDAAELERVKKGLKWRSSRTGN